MTHKDNGQESDPHAGHKMSDIQATHDRHAGHSIAMFRNKFWLSFALTIPVAFWTTDVQHWLGYTAPPFPGSKFIPPILGTVVFIHGTWGELADHKPGMALKALATLLPDTPERVKGAETESVPLSELRVGDIVLVRPGENQNLIELDCAACFCRSPDGCAQENKILDEELARIPQHGESV